jgi:TolA-binding protein
MVVIGLLMTVPFLTTQLYGDDEQDYGFYIDALEKLRDKNFQNILIKELTEYIQRFPNATNLDDMQFKIATLYSESNDKINSFFSHMERIYLDPESKHISTAKDRISRLLMKDKKFKPLKDRVEDLLNPTYVDSSNESSSFTFIRDMFDYNFEPITKMLVAACDQFLSRYPKSSEADAILFLKAELLTKDKQYREALAEYMKLTYVYNESPYVTTSKLRMADLFTKNLDRHEDAVLTLEEFLVEFPDDPQAALAQFRMAQIMEKKKKRYLDALNTYLAVAEKYPKSLEAVPALFEAARLYEKKFKEYERAVRIYNQIVRDFANDIKAPYALSEAGRIYEKRLKDYASAASEYFKVFEKYPESKIAPNHLYLAAELYEKKIKDFNQAITFYRKVVDNYPEQKLAEKASKRIEKLTKEMNK